MTSLTRLQGVCSPLPVQTNVLALLGLFSDFVQFRLKRLDLLVSGGREFLGRFLLCPDCNRSRVEPCVKVLSAFLKQEVSRSSTPTREYQYSATHFSRSSGILGLLDLSPENGAASVRLPLHYQKIASKISESAYVSLESSSIRFSSLTRSSTLERSFSALTELRLSINCCKRVRSVWTDRKSA
jgi:hypothetical protein